MRIDDLADLLGRYWYRAPDEDVLQEGIALVLAENGVEFARERDLAGGRLDFWADGVAIEAKVGGSLLALTRQVQRYCLCDEVAGVIVVSRRRAHDGLPTLLAGKPVRFVYSGGAL